MNRPAEIRFRGEKTHTSVVKERGWLDQATTEPHQQQRQSTETDQPNEQRKKQNRTIADAQPALAVSVPTGGIHLTSSTSESARPRAQHLVISEIRSQPRQRWSNQTHLWTNGSLFTAYSQWETAPSVHVYTVNARDTPEAPVLTLWEFTSPSISWN